MKLSEKNQCMIDNLSMAFDISKNQVIDNIITEYRARRASKRLEFNEPDFLLEFSEIDDELLTDERLFVFLVTQYRQEMEKERNARFERELSIAKPELVKQIYQEYGKEDELSEREYKFKRLSMAYHEGFLSIDYSKKKPFTTRDEHDTEYFYSVLKDYDKGVIDKEEVMKKIERWKNIKEINRKTNFNNK